MFLGVILATLSVIVLGYFKGNISLLTTLKNAREFYSDYQTICIYKGDTWEWEETPEVVAAVAQLTRQLKTLNVELQTLI